MRDCIVSKMVAWLLENNSIMQDEAEIYEFGIKQMLNVCLNVITTISIGVIMGQVLQSSQKDIYNNRIYLFGNC